jgi:hypothetical protein
MARQNMRLSHILFTCRFVGDITLGAREVTMFWDSVAGGLKVFTYWQTWVATLEYLLLFMTPMGVIGYLMQRSDRAAFGVGCLSVVLMPLLQVAAQVVLILTLWPIILGLGDNATWEFPFQLMSQAPGTFIKLVVALVIAAVVLSFIPFFGQLQSLHTLLLGVIALGFVITILKSIYPGAFVYEVHYWPGFWFVLGLVAVGAIVSWVGFLVAAFAVLPLKAVAEGLEQLVIFPIAAVFGFIPVFMYGAWLGAQLKGIQ